VRKQAAATLYAFAGENIPEKYEHIQALARFIPQDVLKQQAQLVNKSIPVLTPTPVSKLMNEKATTIPSSTSAKAAIFSRVEPTKKNDGFFSFQRKERTYIIQKGDNLWKIGRKYNIDVDKLRNHNKLSDDRLQIGQVIKLPQ
jgi:LysM repeat protein